ncbi:hypothetical protein ACHAWF_010732, partial [Thalassiosira exigua]
MNVVGIKAVCLSALLLETRAHEVVKPGALRKGADENSDGSSLKGLNEDAPRAT